MTFTKAKGPVRSLPISVAARRAEKVENIKYSADIYIM